MRNPAYLINNKPLESVTSYKYLGIHITNNLSWHKHIEHITTKANHTLGYLCRNFHALLFSSKQLLNTTYICPQLEYVSALWDLHLIRLTQRIEAIRNCTAHFTLSNYHRTSSKTTTKA